MAASRTEDPDEELTLKVEHEAVLDHDHRVSVIRRLLLTALARGGVAKDPETSDSAGSADSERDIN